VPGTARVDVRPELETKRRAFLVHATQRDLIDRFEQPLAGGALDMVEAGLHDRHLTDRPMSRRFVDLRQLVVQALGSVPECEVGVPRPLHGTGKRVLVAEGHGHTGVGRTRPILFPVGGVFEVVQVLRRLVEVSEIRQVLLDLCQQRVRLIFREAEVRSVDSDEFGTVVGHESATFLVTQRG
jgi:hypothetical protein